MNQTKLKGINLSKFKLDLLGPVDNRPSTNKLHHFVQIFLKDKKYIYIYFLIKMLQKIFWQATGDTWQMTCDRWHVTGDMQHMTHDK